MIDSAQVGEARRAPTLVQSVEYLRSGPPHGNQTLRVGDIPVVDVPVDIPEEFVWVDSPPRILKYSWVK